MFALSGGGLGGDVTGTSVRIASPVFALAVHVGIALGMDFGPVPVSGLNKTFGPGRDQKLELHTYVKTLYVEVYNKYVCCT
jgi:hypothetical protein